MCGCVRVGYGCVRVGYGEGEGSREGDEGSREVVMLEGIFDGIVFCMCNGRFGVVFSIFSHDPLEYSTSDISSVKSNILATS